MHFLDVFKILKMTCLKSCDNSVLVFKWQNLFKVWNQYKITTVQSDSRVKCLTRDQWVMGSSLNGGTACVIEQDTLSSA